MREIHCKWTHSNPPARIMTDEYGPFSDETYEQAILYVPEFASEMYQSQYLKGVNFKILLRNNAYNWQEQE